MPTHPHSSTGLTIQGQVQLYGKTAPPTAGNTSVKRGGSQGPGPPSTQKAGLESTDDLWPVLALYQNSRAEEL